jgi:hypothetical protein
MAVVIATSPADSGSMPRSASWRTSGVGQPWRQRPGLAAGRPPQQPAELGHHAGEQVRRDPVRQLLDGAPAQQNELPARGDQAAQSGQRRRRDLPVAGDRLVVAGSNGQVSHVEASLATDAPAYTRRLQCRVPVSIQIAQDQNGHSGFGCLAWSLASGRR